MRMHTTRRAAYTLFEIILVMAVIVIVTAISVPVVRTMLTDTRISAAADTVRGQMTEARARAMEEGRPWKLAVITNTGTFQLAPDDSTEWSNSSAQEPERKPDLIRGQLPEDVIFSLTHDAIMGKPTPDPPGTSWEAIAVFLPDGTARDDSTIYVGQSGIAPMRLQLRALTGAIIVEEFQQVKASLP